MNLGLFAIWIFFDFEQRARNGTKNSTNSMESNNELLFNFIFPGSVTRHARLLAMPGHNTKHITWAIVCVFVTRSLALSLSLSSSVIRSPDAACLITAECVHVLYYYWKCANEKERAHALPIPMPSTDMYKWACLAVLLVRICYCLRLYIPFDAVRCALYEMISLGVAVLVVVHSMVPVNWMKQTTTHAMELFAIHI